ncbi:MAG: nuclear transport factor 2 family protein [Ignavibacteria bacterium]|nr:nuclear transport factor 2 family protein [Ignavibacteria bacterium]
MVALLLLLQLGSATAADSIAQLLEVQQTAWNRGDIEGYMQGYWKSDSLVFTSGGSVNRGWDATYAKYLRSYDTPEKMGTLRFHSVEISVFPGGTASVLGRWELQRTGDRPAGVFSLLLRRFPDGWRIILDHTSRSNP